MKKILDFVNTYWLMILNPLVILLTYSELFEKGFTLTEVILALTLLVNIGYWGYKIFNKK